MNFFIDNPLLSAERRQREVQTAAPPSQYNLFLYKSIAARVLWRWLVKVLVFVFDRLRHLMPPYYPTHLPQHRVSGSHIAVSNRINNIDALACKLSHFAKSQLHSVLTRARANERSAMLRKVDPESINPTRHVICVLAYYHAYILATEAAKGNDCIAQGRHTLGILLCDYHCNRYSANSH